MKVWLVWTGEYSDKNVDAVCSSEAAANALAMEIGASWVDECDVDERTAKPETVVWWHCQLNNSWWPERPDSIRSERLAVSLMAERSGDRQDRPSDRYARPWSRSLDEDVTVGKVRVFRRPNNAGWDMYTNVAAPTPEAAAKIATERFQGEIAYAAMMGRPLERGRPQEQAAETNRALEAKQ